jgi:hypothetical protein
MSALGQKRTFRGQAPMSALPLKRTSFDGVEKSALCQKRTTGHPYSISSSARDSSVGGTLMPSAVAVFILMTSWKRVGCSTGKSAG